MTAVYLWIKPYIRPWTKSGSFLQWHPIYRAEGLQEPLIEKGCVLPTLNRSLTEHQRISDHSTTVRRRLSIDRRVHSFHKSLRNCVCVRVCMQEDKLRGTLFPERVYGGAWRRSASLKLKDMKFTK